MFFTEEGMIESQQLASASWRLMPIHFLPPLPLAQIVESLTLLKLDDFEKRFCP